MGRISRRVILKSGAIGAGLGLLGSTGFTKAWAATPAIRYNANSAKGKAMLKIYAQAVAKMMATPEGEPLSWTFQWYTHFVRGDTTKAQEISRIYGAADSPNKQLATAMWNTCQAHSPGQNEDNFLPWHRMFVYYFEQIIRQVSGNAAFTLPYWDYTNPNNQSIPPEFHMPDDPVFKSLYRPDRTIGAAGAVNAGVAITRAFGAPAAALNLDAMIETEYSTRTGFCQQLDGGLHGNVHVFTGNQRGMGRVPWAANDPVFWIHHCNIDRIWASWNAAGRTNPNDAAWKATTFTFANDKGQPVQPAIGDYLDIAPLNYSYDVLVKPPASGLPVAAVAQPARAILTSAAAPLKETEPAVIQLSKASVGAVPSPSLKDVAGKRAVYLQISGVSASDQPGMAYNVFLDLPANAPATMDSPHYVGTLNFFDAAGHGEHAGHGQPVNKVRTFNITRAAARLNKARTLTDTPRVTLVPSDEPAENSKPMIGEISLIVR